MPIMFFIKIGKKRFNWLKLKKNLKLYFQFGLFSPSFISLLQTFTNIKGFVLLMPLVKCLSDATLVIGFPKVEINV